MVARDTLDPDNTGSDPDGEAYTRDVSAKVGTLFAYNLGLLENVAGTNTITATCSETLQAYSGQLFGILIPANTNTGTVTVNIDSLGAKAVKTAGGSNLTAGDLVANKAYTLFYDGTDFRVFEVGDTLARSEQVSRWGYQRNEATDGATPTTGSWADYPLNTALEDNISGTSLASSAITLPAGEYDIEAEILVHGREIDGLLRLYNDTDGAVVTTCFGQSLWADDVMRHQSTTSGNAEAQTYSATEPTTSTSVDGSGAGQEFDGGGVFSGRFMVRQNRSVAFRLAGTLSISAAKDIKLQYYLGTRDNSGSSNRISLGRAVDVTGYPEIYGWIKVTKKTTPGTIRALVYNNYDQDIIPDTASAYDLGSSSKPWDEIYGDDVYQGGKKLACELVSSSSVSASSSEVDITGLTSDYFMYDIVIHGLTFSTDGTLLRLRTSTDGGSTFDSGGTDYETSAQYNNGGSFGAYRYNDALPLIANLVGAAAGEDMTLTLRVFNPAGARYSRIKFCATFLDSSGHASEYAGQVFRLSAADIDAIRLFPGAGTLDDGDIRVYGWRAS